MDGRWGLTYEQMLAAFIEGNRELGPGEPVREPMKLYRIEMENGNGPYNSGLPNSYDIYEVICGEMGCHRNAILNREQMGYTDRAFREAHGHANYACVSIEALCDWFPLEARSYLKQFGARVVEYHVPVGAYVLETGHGEVVFNRHECQPVGELDIIELGGEMVRAA